MKISITIFAMTISSLVQASHFQQDPSPRPCPPPYQQTKYPSAAPVPLDQATDPLQSTSWIVTSSNEPRLPSNEERIAALSSHVQHQQQCISMQARKLYEQNAHLAELEHQACVHSAQIYRLQQDVTRLLALLRSPTQ